MQMLTTFICIWVNVLFPKSYNTDDLTVLQKKKYCKSPNPVRINESHLYSCTDLYCVNVKKLLSLLRFVCFIGIRVLDRN